MNKILTATVALFVGTLVGTAQTTTPGFLWGNMFDGATSAGDQSEGVATDSKGNAYWHLIGGTTTDMPDVNYGGSVLFQGAPYEGTSQNNNLCILKTDSDGKPVWKLYSNYGDFSNNSGSIQTTTAGDIVFSAKVRATEGFESEGIRLVDGTGSIYTYSFDSNADRRYYNVMLGSISSDGKLQWVKFVNADYKKITDSAFCADAIECQGLALDSNDNIYLGGLYCTPLSIEGSNTVLTPHNSTDWDGNAQRKIGDVFVIKYNSKGDYLSNATLAGTVTSEKMISMDIVNDKLYLQLYLEGNGKQTSFGGKTFTLEGAATLTIVKADTDFTASWITPIKAEKASNQLAYQNGSTNSFDGNVWVAAQVTGKFTDQADATHTVSNSAALREGMLIKLNDATGAWEAATMSKTDYSVSALTGYFKVYPNPEDSENVFVYGYGMNANVGVFLRKYHAETLVSNPEDAVMLVSSGMMASCQASAYDMKNGRLFITARSNAAMTVLGGTVFAKPAGWGILTAAYSMPKEKEISSGVDFTKTANDLKVYGGNGTLTIENNGIAIPVEVFDMTGRIVAAVNAEGKTELNLNSGIYIVAGKKTLVK
ncbi:MAG: T9SS type A sorting domain-containing protein [Muribaculum sp.]|nr:T9SS type A sorting domain-containing protein [Muribaculum sp.]